MGDLVVIVMEDIANMDTETMAINIHSEAWDYSGGMVHTVSVDMVTTEAVTVDIILLMVISMGDLVVTLKATRSLSHTCNLKSMASPKHTCSLKPTVNLQLIVNLQLMASLQLIANLKLLANLKHIANLNHIANLKLIANLQHMVNPKRIHLKHLTISSNLRMHVL